MKEKDNMQEDDEDDSAPTTVDDLSSGEYGGSIDHEAWGGHGKWFPNLERKKNKQKYEVKQSMLENAWKEATRSCAGKNPLTACQSTADGWIVQYM